MNGTLITSLVLSLFFTVVLEAGFFALKSKLFPGSHDKKDLMLVVLLNVITNPVVVMLYWITVLYTNRNTATVLIPLELFAILTEGYYYKKYGSGFHRPYLLSAAANIFSFGTGFLIQMFF